MGDVEELSGLVEAVRAELAGRVPAQLTAADVLAIRTQLEPIAARLDEPAASPEARAWLDARLAALYAQAAALAIAGGDDINAERWLAIAEARAPGDAVLAAARRTPERFRLLAEGRALRTLGRTRDAIRCWKRVRGADALTAAARAELAAPIPLGPDETGPIAWSINGLGTRLFGRRDVAADRSYTTTYWLAFAIVPVFPLSAWRVMPEVGGARFLGRARLSWPARIGRALVPGALALVIAIGAIGAYLADPERLARQRFDGAIALAELGGEPGLQILERALRDDLALVDDDRADRAGVVVVTRAAARLATPFLGAEVDTALRIVSRYQALPPRARDGMAGPTLVEQLERWALQVREADPARLELLVTAHELATREARARIAREMIAARLALAKTYADEPLDALAILVDQPDGTASAEASAAADRVVDQLAEAPSLLLDAGADLERWLARAPAERKARIEELRRNAAAGRDDALADGVTPGQLEAMARSRPWDQHVVVQRALREAQAGKLAAAVARLDALGPPGQRIRAARQVHAELVAEQGDLARADAELQALLGDRVRRFRAATIALTAAGASASARIDRELESDAELPEEVRRRLTAAPDDDARGAIVRAYYEDRYAHDPDIVAARARASDLSDVVQVSLTAGALELRRAQALTGAAQAAMLHTAERTFLAIRSEADGHLELRIALGEIAMRLGKTAESEAELAAVLRDGTPIQRYQVAALYRAVGSQARARAIVRELYDSQQPPLRYAAAYMLGQLAERDEAEAWFRKSDPKDRHVRAQLLELEADRLQRAGKLADCAARYLEAAKLRATGDLPSNDVALDYQRSFACNSDPQALRSAEDQLARVYRANPQDPIVVQNYANLRLMIGMIRVIARRVDARALRLRMQDAGNLVEALLSTTPHPSVQAELAADPGMRGGLELLTQYAVLAPNSVLAYAWPMAYARMTGDEAIMTATLERARQAKAIDRAELVLDRTKMEAGDFDARMLESADADLARFEPAIANERLTPRSRAAAELLVAQALQTIGELRGDVAAFQRARALAIAAQHHWPELDGAGLIVATLIDEAAVSVDPKAWLAVRRMRTSTTALARVIRDRAPIADRMRTTPAWAELVRFAPTDPTPPALGKLQLARALHDPVLEARARAALDDRPARLNRELATLLDPERADAQDERLDAR